VIEVRDYVGLTPAQARAQWKAILARSIVSKGSKQDVFAPIETLLCFGLGLIGTRNARGRINIRESDPSTVALALLFKRPAGSLALKLANLDGRRANGAKFEQDLWIVLTSDLHLFRHLYEVIIDAGRVAGLDFDVLPDFLGSESATFGAFLEADQVSTEMLREEVEPEMKKLRDSSALMDPIETERLLLGSARVGQTQFAHAVLDNCGYSCVFCGLGFRAVNLPPSKMLVASHIKAWRASDNSERLDALNGLAACPTHDAAFDSFLITVGDDLSIVRGPALIVAIARDVQVARNFGIGGMLDHLLMPINARPPGPAYLGWHQGRSKVGA
jgi:putative restriction endonuclease